jgi:phosphate transport system substrate-binding protein
MRFPSLNTVLLSREGTVCLRICLLVILLFSLFVPPAWAVGELRYSGSSTIGTGVLQAGATYAFTMKTGIRFAAVEQPGSGQGIRDLVEGKVPLAGVSRPLKAEEEGELTGTVIGYDAIAVFVHQSNPVRSLTRELLKGIFTGRIRNWKEVGGRDAPIRPNTEFLAGRRGTIETFQEMVLEGAAYGTGFAEFDLPRYQLVGVAEDPDGICSVSIGLRAPHEIRREIRAVAVNGVEPTDMNVRNGAYPISRPLFLVTKGSPTGEAKEFLDFMLSDEGQAIVAKNFVPIRD